MSNEEKQPNFDIGLVVHLASKGLPFSTNRERNEFFAWNKTYDKVKLSTALSFARGYTSGVIHSQFDLYRDCCGIAGQEISKFLDYASPEDGTILDEEVDNTTSLALLNSGVSLNQSVTWQLAYLIARGLNGSPGNVVINFVDNEMSSEEYTQKVANFYMDIAEEVGINIVRERLNKDSLYKFITQ
ncbi:hypothetical protein HOC35_05395 [Candidatus Woesearchaeota archaeon]|jgi:hypothetical protein|nr:hypothetical protein [Candidatus Woesearchaeota archaeon]